LQRLLFENSCTVIMVTHDIHEAILLSDKILVFSKPPVTSPRMIEVSLKRPRGEAIAELPEYTAIRHTVIEHLKSFAVSTTK
jgi:NitT/TauT family transport system ATP-binding protein